MTETQIPFSSKKIRSAARDALRGNWTFACIAGLLYEIITVIVRIPIDDSTSSFLISFCIACIQSILKIGFFACFLDIIRKKPLTYSRLLLGYTSLRFFGKILWTEIIASVFLVLWLLLFIIPGIVKAFSYSLVYFILIDHPEYSANEAITKSRKMMDGHKWELFKLIFSFIGWWILCAVTFGIAAIWVTPYFMTAFAKFYENLKDNA